MSLFQGHRLLSALLRLLLVFLCLGASVSQAGLMKFGASGAHKFIPADEAFQLTSDAQGDVTTLHFHITPGYYLYRERFHFDPETSGLTIEKPAFAREGEWKDDPSFGRVEVYHEDLDVSLKTKGSGNLQVTWQGCADAGLCYPPQNQTVAIGTTSTDLATPKAPVSAAGAANLPAAESATAPASCDTNAALPGFFHAGSRLGILAWMLVLGLGLSLTPCVWPMLPILSGIIARQHTQSAGKGFLLSFAYVLGIATTYAAMGALVGSLGQGANLPMWFQHPVVLIAFALLFAVLSLSMFGLYDLQLPQSITNHFDGMSRKAGVGGYVGSYIMGFFSALVVSPCISAPLAGVLLYISTTGNALFGAAALFMLALGVGVPLMILGATEGRFMPRSGDWMVRVKIVMGILLLGVAMLLAGRVLAGPIALVLWAALAAGTAIWVWTLKSHRSAVIYLWRGISGLLAVYAALLLIGAAQANDDPLRPLARSIAGSTSAPVFQTIGSERELDAILQTAAADHKTVMLDFYADWCTSCRIMDRKVFPADQVSTALQQMVLVRADVTANSSDNKALLKRFGLFGPPSILFFKGNQEMTCARVQGEMNANEFLAHLRRQVMAGG